MSNPTNFIDLYVEVRENVMDSLDLAELSLFASANSVLHSAVEKYIQRRRLIIFALFINNPQEFIGILQITDSVISGSAALNIVQARQGAVEINDLDVYTTLANFGDLIRFFTDKEHYKIVGDFHRPPPGPYNNTGIAKVFRLKKKERKIDIIVTHLTAAASLIFQFHNTIVMNFISAEAVFCAYPGWTLNMLGLVHPRMYKQNGTNLSTIKALAKYMKRGFSLYSDIAELGPHDSQCIKTYYCPQITRSTNDKGKVAWVFNRTGRESGTVGSVMHIDKSAIVWCLGGDQCADETYAGSPSFVFAT
ncbi:hypothetical protein DEU56DRAFT_913393 [Suillus clintonianus]|uniref:uncharacterized protein n=1 Tax=Suillus clintonianus TaxID=1904413 RepID=UPI001B85E455|nr:uncharacterized protein DEU56DRAFT_913393 [Suillus clintonianus]KAG2135278.1 hypothetical protein DEU56DRAFT_913393 [Suillus clintonianus]